MKFASAQGLLLAATLGLTLLACGDDSTGSGGGTGTGGAGSGGTASTGETTGATTSSVGGSGATTGATGTSTAETSTGVGGEGGASTATSSSATSSGSGGNAACAGEGFVPVSQDAGNLGDAFIYFALSAEAAPQDNLSIELYSDVGTIGDRTILEEDYAVCNPCVLLRLGCDDNFDNCSQKFLANTGTIHIESFEGTFTGELQGVELVEVTIDDQAHSTPVPGGDVWCLDGYAFEATVQ